MKYLVDSDWLIDVQANIPVAGETINRLSADGVAVSSITVGELYDGAIGSADSMATLMSLRRFLTAFPVLSLNDAIMERIAQPRVPLRRQGLLIPDLDLLAYDLTLLTRNRRHFWRIPDLKLYEAV